MKFYRFTKWLAVAEIIISVLFVVNINTTFAQTTSTAQNSCTTATLTLINSATGQKATSQTIKSSQASKYGLRVNIHTNPVCTPTNFSLLGATYEDVNGSHSTPVQTVTFCNECSYGAGDFQQDTQAFGTPSNTTYSYNLLVNTSVSSVTTHINVTFTDDKGNINKNGIGGNLNTNSRGGSNANNSNTPLPDVNTGVSANFNTNFDSTISLFPNLLNIDSVPALIAALVKILFTLTGLVAVVVIIIAGFRMVMSQGNESEITKGKKAITWAIAGLIVSILAFSIVAIIQSIIRG